MKIKICIFYLLMLVFSGPLLGQKQQSKYSGKRMRPEVLLKKAQTIHKKDPSAAIRLLDELINQKSKSRNNLLKADAYALLGDIYKDINQEDLALQRYKKALQLLSKSQNFNKKAELHYQIGLLHLKQTNIKEAKINFSLCLTSEQSYGKKSIKSKNSGSNKKLKQLCEEGLADVELVSGNSQNSIARLDNVQQNYQLDSLSNSRVEAKRAQVYAQNKDYYNAYKALKNSESNLPRNQKVNKKDYQEIEKAKKEILEIKTIDTRQRINTLEPVKGLVKPSDATIRENLQIASLYESVDNLVEAERFVNASKTVIDDKTEAASVAEVFKKSAEINQKNGAYNEALEDFEKYIQAKEQAIQDLEESLQKQVEIVKSQQQIDLDEKDLNLEKKDEELLRAQVGTQKWVIGLLLLLLIASFIFYYFLNKNVKAKRQANQFLLLKSLRTQMNPHFIFNALNSVNNFIAKNNEKDANKFLSEFSRLMRKVLDHSQKDLVSFEEEMELNELYLKLEHFRFRDRFDYQFEKNININTFDLDVPPILIQPFIENAVWHGLRYKEGKGMLEVAVNEVANNIIVTIKDNGIGRKRSAELKTANQKKYKSTGLENVSRRIMLINEVYNKNYEINVEDLDSASEDTGTKVTIKIPK